MANQEIKSNTNIGSSSLILIFIVLCLATFGLLSLSSAKSDWVLAEKNAKAVKGYYQADNTGEEFYRMADQSLAKAYEQGTDVASRSRLLKESLGDYYREEDGKIMTDITMERGQALHIELLVDQNEWSQLEIGAWTVFNQEDYEIDTSMPVWGGQ